ncbi:hypothetical protein CRP143_gp5 [Roseobacter phage CRP-143]|nr:hypothetical protein CRP143_gp5 [Roseobacter phage CRP-143]
MARYQVIENPRFEEIEVGDTIEVRTSWGTGRLVYGVVMGTEVNGKNEQNVVDYHVEGNKYDNWAYDYQIDKLIKEL